jgi:antitoxin PrlF
MLTSRITSKGQTTVPREVREKLSLRPGDAVVYVEENGRILLMKQPKREPVDDPFASFSEWNSPADESGYGEL